jgi:predicted molibdopterin-dependent oxidoreductase YjgC
MLTGNVGKESAGVYPIRGSNNVQGACDMGLLPNFLPGYQSIKTERAKFERRWGVSLADKSGLTATELIDSAHKRELKALYIVGENPMVSFPVIAHVKEGLEKLEFLVVQDLFLSETAQLANVILPVASFAEKDGTFTNTERRVQRIRKAIEPIGKSKADWEIIQELSKKMNYPMDYSIPSQIFKEIAELVPIYKGISYRRLKREGIQWPCLDKSQFGTKFLHKGKFARGKGRFYPIEYKEPRELPNKEYPFLLTTGRLLYQFHTGTMTRKSQDLEEICPKGYIEINPADAKALAIKDGEELKVSSKRGSINIDSKVTEKVPKALVFIPFHFAEAAANVLTNPALDPIAKIPEYKVCAVRLEKLPRF